MALARLSYLSRYTGRKITDALHATCNRGYVNITR